MKTANHSLSSAASRKHLRPDHSDGGRLKDYTTSLQLSKLYLKGTDLDIAKVREDFGFANLQIGTGSPGFCHAYPSGQLIPYEDWPKFQKAILDANPAYMSRGKVKRLVYPDPNKSCEVLAVTLRPDHVLTLKLAGEPVRNEALIHELGVLCAKTMEAWHPVVCPVVPGWCAHMLDSMPHLHMLYQDIKEQKLLWPTHLEKGGYRLLLPDQVAPVRLTRAGLYSMDPYAKSWLAANCQGQKSASGMALDLELAFKVDDHVQAYIESDPKLSGAYGRVREAYKAYLDYKTEHSPRNVAAANARLKKELADQKDIIAKLAAQVEAMANARSAPVAEKQHGQPALVIDGEKVVVLSLYRGAPYGMPSEGEQWLAKPGLTAVVKASDKVEFSREDADKVFAAAMTLEPLDPAPPPVDPEKEARWKAACERFSAHYVTVVAAPAAPSPVKPVDEREAVGMEIAPPKATPQPVPAPSKAPEPEVVSKAPKWPEVRKPAQEAILVPEAIIEVVQPTQAFKRKKLPSEMTKEEQLEDLLAELSI